MLPFAPEDRIPTTIVTGFLGSGKTTLINRLLHMAEMADAAVIVNEYGEIGIDNHLIEKVDGNITLLESGCVCCTVQDELSLTMHDLVLRRERGEIPRFNRLVIETTGLADPGPISNRLLTEPSIATFYTLASVVTTVDSINGVATLRRHAEAVRQAALADRLVLTKTDIGDGHGVDELVDAIRAVNHSGEIVRAADGILDPGMLASVLTDPMSDAANLGTWLGAVDHRHDDDDYDHDDHRDSENGIQTFSLVREEPMSWAQIARWLKLLGEEDGDRLLRVKGIVNIDGQAGPTVIHGVQRIIHLPKVLSEWPSEDRRTRVVFITDGVAREHVEGLLEEACAV